MPASYAPLGDRRQAVVIVFSFIALISALAVVSDLLEIALLDRLIGGEDVPSSELDGNDARQGVIGLLQFVLLVAGATVFIRWMHRAYQNVDVVDPSERRYGHGWAIGSWFVPILNLWRPKQIVNDIWRAGGRDDADKKLSPMLLAWWVVWTVSAFVANFAIRRWFDGDSPEELRSGTIAWAVSDGMDVVAAILAIVIVRAATDRLDGRAAELPSPQPDDRGGQWAAPERPTGLPV